MDIESVVANLVQRIERRYFGKYRGLVVDNADPEQLGRLKIQVPSVLGSEVVSGWATPCAPYGGDANQGIFFIPEVGAGVWVEFEEGDLEFPIWVGTFWGKPSGESELPKPNAPDGSEEGSVQDPPTRKMIKTLKGHTIQFEDADDHEMVTIVEATNAHVVTLNADGINITEGINGHKIVLNDKGVKIIDGANGHEVVLDSNGITLTDGVNSGNKTTMDSGGVTLESASDVTIKGQNITIEAQAQLTAKGNPVHLNP